MLRHDRHLIRPGQVIIGDKGFAGREFKSFITDELQVRLIRRRLLALTARIWHNWLIGEPNKRSLTAYDR